MVDTPVIIRRFQTRKLPALIQSAGEKASKRFLEFFAANIRNKNSRAAYARAVGQFFRWCEVRKIELDDIEPLTVSAYIEELGTRASKPTVKQHLAAIRMLFDWLVVGQIVPSNPAHSVRGPKHVVKKGTTPVLSGEQARQLLESIELTSVGLRDRAIIGAMLYSFARVSAVVGMNVEDYWQNGKRYWLRLHEKGGKHHEVPVHHELEQYLDEYLKAYSPALPSSPLFVTVAGRSGELTAKRMTRNDALRMIKRRVKKIGLPWRVCCHSFRATGITAYLENGGTIENAQAIAAHESPRTTKLYDRTEDEISLDEIERIRL